MIESRIGFYKDDAASLISEPAMRPPSERISWLLAADARHEKQIPTSTKGRWVAACSHEGEFIVAASSSLGGYEYFHRVAPGCPLHLYLAHGAPASLEFRGVSPVSRAEYIVSESPFPAET